MAKASKTATQPVWHPDFRIPDELPDIKPIRTTFLINLVCLMLFLVLAGYYVFNQIRVGELRTELADLQEQVREARPGSAQAVRGAREFSQLAKVPDDLIVFEESVYNIPAIILALSEACPDNVMYRELNLAHQLVSGRRRLQGRYLNITLSAFLQGQTNDDVQQIDVFAEKIRNLPILQDKIKTLEVPELRPEPTVEHRFAFTVSIQLKTIEP
ncbi:MAG: hypothetical protein ACFB21_08005 [Opitutales bacterium]